MLYCLDRRIFIRKMHRDEEAHIPKNTRLDTQAGWQMPLVATAYSLAALIA